MWKPSFVGALFTAVCCEKLAIVTSENVARPGPLVECSTRIQLGYENDQPDGSL